MKIVKFEDIQLTSLVNTWDLEKNLSKNHLMDKMDFGNL